MVEPFTIIEHTADVGLRVSGASLDDLFSNAALGMFSLMCDVAAVRAETPTRIAVEDEDDAYRLHDWLAELLYEFDTHHRIFSRFEVTNSTGRTQGIAWGEAVAPDRHDLSTEIKAVTAHRLCVERRDDLWVATIIFDL